MASDKTSPKRDRTLLFPILLGIFSLLGIFLILRWAWFPAQNGQALPTQTATTFKYLFLATETFVPMPAEGRESRQTGPSTNEDFSKTVVTSAASIEPIITVQFSERCSPPDAEFLDAVGQVIGIFDPSNRLSTSWMVKSSDQSELWFVAAKIHGPNIENGSTPPGVWALLFYSEGYFDVYSINEIAIKYSFAAWGESSDPAMTMQTDGAQEAHDCALR